MSSPREVSRFAAVISSKIDQERSRKYFAYFLDNLISLRISGGEDQAQLFEQLLDRRDWTEVLDSRIASGSPNKAQDLNIGALANEVNTTLAEDSLGYFCDFVEELIRLHLDGPGSRLASFKQIPHTQIGGALKAWLQINRPSKISDVIVPSGEGKLRTYAIREGLRVDEQVIGLIHDFIVDPDSRDDHGLGVPKDPARLFSYRAMKRRACSQALENYVFASPAKMVPLVDHRWNDFDLRVAERKAAIKALIAGDELEPDLQLKLLLERNSGSMNSIIYKALYQWITSEVDPVQCDKEHAQGYCEDTGISREGLVKLITAYRDFVVSSEANEIRIRVVESRS